MLTCEEWDINRLVPYARNPRKNDSVVDRMCSAIREFGFRIPIVAKSDGTVVDGHLRLKAAKKLGLDTVPVVLADDLTDTQIKAFRLLANQSANWAEWDTDLLKLEMEDLKLDDFNLNLTGFDENQQLELTKNMSVLEDDKSSDVDENLYTNKISTPQYIPTGRKVTFADCLDTSKRDELIEKINNSSLNEDQKIFLRDAAERFLKFSYSNIAELYANSNPDMQELMEELALVIIDYNDAIQNGFVILTKKLETICQDIIKSVEDES